MIQVGMLGSALWKEWDTPWLEYSLQMHWCTVKAIMLLFT